MVDGESLWERQDPVMFRENLGLLVERLDDHFRALDDNRIAGSRYCSLYVSMTAPAGFLLSCRSVTGRMRVIRQLRTANVRVISIYVAGNSYKVDPGEQCTICNLRENESLYHILLGCPIYNPIRNEYLNKYIMPAIVIDGGNFHEVLLNIIQINNIYHFICGAMRLRSFIMNE